MSRGKRTILSVVDTASQHTFAFAKKLWQDRTYLGNMMGSLESWLLLRSLRTLHLRVPRQASNATELAQWLNKAALVGEGGEYDGIPGGLITKVWHSSIQALDADWDIQAQMEGGWNATFSLLASLALLASGRF